MIIVGVSGMLVDSGWDEVESEGDEVEVEDVDAGMVSD